MIIFKSGFRSRRFTTEVPIKDGLNWYVYVGNDPVNYIDNLGLYAETIWDIINVGLGANSTVNSIKEGDYITDIINEVGEVEGESIYESNLDSLILESSEGNNIKNR